MAYLLTLGLLLTACLCFFVVFPLLREAFEQVCGGRKIAQFQRIFEETIEDREAVRQACCAAYNNRRAAELAAERARRQPLMDRARGIG